MKHFLLAFSLFLTSTIVLQAQCNGRYQQDIFSQVDLTTAVEYGEADGQKLYMDIYQGQGDMATDRPVIILCFGGSFVAGSRTTSDIVAFCEAMARKGYVTAAIDYRLESPLNIIFQENMVKAVMRAVQDGKAAVRFFRKDVANGNTYGIDSSSIFIGGTSAGGILALHVAYMRDLQALPANWQTWAGDLGGLEGNSGNPGYSSEVAGVISFAGALGDSAWLKTNDVPFMTVHAENDGTVPFEIGYPLGLSSLPDLYGSKVLNHRADILGISNEFYPYQGSDHPPFMGSNGLKPVVVDSTVQQMTRFLYKLIPCGGVASDIELLTESDGISIFPNPLQNGILNIKTNGRDFDQLTVYDLGGRVLFQQEWDGSASLDLSAVPTGVYLFEMIDLDQPGIFRKKIWKP